MADNIELNPGTGGAVIATDDDGTAQHQYVKLEYGADGTFTKVSTSNPLPVSDAGGSLTVDGTVSVTGVATAANQSTQNTALAAIQAAVELIDNAISGTEMQVDIVAPLPAGSNTIGAVNLGTLNGAATAANQSTANGLLGTIDTDTGNIATAASAIQTAVQVMDDWDESDRLKNNPIVGQAGVAAGAGAVGVTTQRMTLASDDPAVALLTTIDADTGNVASSTSTTATNTGNAATSLAVIDDWDESDRAKVNVIAGQAGIAAGAGAVGANTPRVTLASDDPAVALLSTIDADTSALAATINTGRVQVDGSGVTQPVSGTVTANLGATDNAVLDTVASPVATISATPLQRVAIFDDADSQITSFGGGTEYTEDAAAAANPVGKANILVRADTPAGVASADGDNVAQRGTNFGAAFCQIVDSSGNFVDSFGGAGGTSSADDAEFVAGTTLGTIAQGVYESTPTSVTDGDVGAVGITSDRQLKTSDAAAVALLTTIDADTGSAATLLGTIDADTSTLAGAVSGTEMQVDIVASLPAGSNTIGVVDLGATDNAVLDAIAASVAGTLTVDLGANNDVVASGAAAHDAAVSGNPVLTGLEARSTAPTAVGDGDAVRALATILGKQVVMPYALPAQFWSYAAASGGITDTTGVTAKAAAGAGVVNYITHVSAVNGHETVDTDVQIRDGASGTVLWRSFAKAGGGGISEKFDPPLKGTANTLVEVANGTTGSATYFNLQGYTGAE